jgi:Holliday junction resolvase RusA-like endonuclease
MKIIIPDTPISKNRHKCGCTRDRRPFVYDPQIKAEMNDIRDYISRSFLEAIESKNQQIALEASEIASAQYFDVSLVFIFSPPLSLTVGLRNALLWGFHQYNQKPDLDNLEKFYLDCATGSVWDDDCKIVSLNSKKIYGENARTEMTVMAKKDFTMGDMHMKVLSLFSPSEMLQLLKDAHCLSEQKDWPIFDPPSGGQGLWFAQSVISFSNKYADKLMKVKKIAAKDIPDEVA